MLTNILRQIAIVLVNLQQGVSYSDYSNPFYSIRCMIP